MKFLNLETILELIKTLKKLINISKKKDFDFHIICCSLIDMVVFLFVSRFLADADWDSVYRYTMIKDDILHEFRNKQWVPYIYILYLSIYLNHCD